jgi:hypothetical protein
VPSRVTVALSELYDFLERLHFIGKLSPWRKGDPAKPVIGLLVPVDTALEEARYGLRLDVTRHDFIKLLEKDGISMFTNIEQFVKAKEKTEHSAKNDTTRWLLNDICEAIEVSKRNIDYRSPITKWVISGRNGYIYADETNWFVAVSANSKRHFSSFKRKLSFMALAKDDIDKGEFRLDRMPSPDEAILLRKVVGLKKRPKNDRPNAKSPS